MNEKIETLECVMAELGYKTYRHFTTKRVQVVVGEVRVICDDVELVQQSEQHSDWGYVANLFLDGRFVASVNRWLIL